MSCTCRLSNATPPVRAVLLGSERSDARAVTRLPSRAIWLKLTESPGMEIPRIEDVGSCLWGMCLKAWENLEPKWRFGVRGLGV